MTQSQARACPPSPLRHNAVVRTSDLEAQPRVQRGDGLIDRVDRECHVRAARVSQAWNRQRLAAETCVDPAPGLVIATVDLPARVQGGIARD
jgi:hypothetical protein